ncbi:aminoglycoside phosphotransferase [Paenibacillus crassostreae]|uniref:Aminoglycoside phosphotransferase n=1 Tax=Paenibacillus crassostreae TaxID=1763538 RepID=A0A162KW47_9BACL|nr:aminoglycoside phosphotransferase [Paenibacillus crassostreae]OAB74913.1 aminoglycoside phosphotransferase [Paenibacillus crassostreae]
MIESVVRKYWLTWRGSIQKGIGGWNNTTYFVGNDDLRYVLRCYETHRDREKIEFEHAILESLQHQSLSFKVPIPVKALDGQTIVQMDDGSGKFACLFEYIEGLSPKESNTVIANSFGEVTGELSVTLARVNLDIAPAYRPYYELEKSYPICTREVVLDFCENPPEAFDDLTDILHKLRIAYIEICESLTGLEKLPQQLVHGDLNESNLLVHKEHVDQVCALLDFEFCTIDVRAMEPAVVISGLLGHQDEIATVRQFCTGFASKVQLLPEEVAAIPILMRLRKVDVFLHFLSRYLMDTDGPEVLREQVQLLVADLKQLELSWIWIEKELNILAKGT